MLRHVLTATAVVIALLSAAGCGDGNGSLSQARDYAESPGSTIAKQAREAMAGLKAVHIDGDVLEPDGTRVLLNLDTTHQGSCKGTISVGDGKIDLRAVGSSAWIRADQTFWDSIAPGQGKRFAKKIGTRWVALSGQLSTLRSFCNIDSLTNRLLPESATIKSLGPAMVSAVPTVRLEVTHGEDSGGAFVVAADPHRIARLTQGDTGQLDFSDFDEEFAVVAPTSGQIFDLKGLEKKN